MPKKLASLGFGRRATPAQKTLVVQKLRQKYSLNLLLSIAQLPRATFYYHLKRMQKTDKYASVMEEITTIFHENKGSYGYRRITTVLRSRGFLMNHKTVQRLMKELGMICRVRMKKYRSYKGNVGKIAPNLLNRNFHADKPNQKWVTDVTEFSLFGEKLYLSPILDLHSSDLVSYTISDRPVLSMVTTMLDKAFAKIPDGTDLILHSDQGWQYQHKQYQRMLREKGIRQSMSRKGNCLDNAVIENFFGLLKSELLYLQEFHSMEHFKQELIEYLDYYNNRRIKAKLKGLPPAIHRQQALSVA
ncbi:IS3 family transposase [Butyricicoccus sp. OF13-6]|nr:IS3 family transposase [Butyricicoccus sp. OF13-6]